MVRQSLKRWSKRRMLKPTWIPKKTNLEIMRQAGVPGATNEQSH